ncbi:MAG: FtsX-like permease family protein [Dehalococcoidia bacterium]|nr:FtsX-like permease family protein [Dehalococcoidia bacterium]
MDSLFGIPMNSIMIAMIVLLAIALFTVAFTAFRNRVMFLIGLRNIPRRVAQTVLIIIGLMLSTLIVSAAFTTGDTVDHTITKTAYDVLGHVDEIVQFETQAEGVAFAGSDLTIPSAVVDDLEAVTSADPDIDGMAPVLLERVPAVNEETRLSIPNVGMVGLDPERMEAFPDVVSLDGRTLRVGDLAEDEVYLNESAADELDVQAGDTVTVYFRGEPLRFRVAEVVQDKAVTGAVGFESRSGIAARLDVLQRLFGREGNVDFVVISNTGGVRDSVGVTDQVVERLETAIEQQRLDLTVEPTKQENLEFAEEFGNGIMTFFIILGLFSIAAGILLIIMIFVMLAAERKTEMGISRAVGTKRRHLVQMFMSEGMGYNLLSAAVGVMLGVLVSLLLTGVMAAVFSEFDISVEPNVTARSLIISYSLGVVMTFLTVVFASWRASSLNIVRAIRDLPEPESRPGWRTLLSAIVLILFGAFLMFTGVSVEQLFPYAFGFSLIMFAVAIGGRYARLPERPLFTATGLILLVWWLLGAGGHLPEFLTANREMAGGVEIFFLSGITMVAAATFVIVYNADLLLHFFTLLGSRMTRILPALKTAVAYPLASKFRTGMTMAMIALVVFALTMMSAMNANFDRLFLSEESRGGWDIEVIENPNNPLGDLRAALEAEGSVNTDAFADVGRLDIAQPFATELRQRGQEEFSFFVVKGADEEFLADTRLGLQARARGYVSDEAVWQAVRSNRNLAVIDNSAIPQDFGFGGGMEIFRLDGIDAQTTEFDPITIQVRDRATAVVGEVTLVGVLNVGATGMGPFSTFGGLITSQRFIQEVFGQPEYSTYVIRLSDPGAAEDTAKAIEAALFTSGAQASSIKAERESDQALFRGLQYLMQGFMGLGLIVGIAAVGVIAFRTVVERRQQIGMLRAIGYSRGTVALSLLMESSFVTLLGILSGLGLAILLSYFLITSDEFAATGIKGFYIPWLELSFICLFAYIASLVMTFIPSRQAAGIPIAEALRYE